MTPEQRVRDLHVPHPFHDDRDRMRGPVCSACNYKMPCPTIAALDSDGETNGG